MKKGKLIIKNDKFIIQYLDSYSGRDNGGYEKERIGTFDIEIHPDFPIDTLNNLLNEELEFRIIYHKFPGKNGWIYEEKVADIKLSLQQSRDIKINEIIK